MWRLSNCDAATGSKPDSRRSPAVGSEGFLRPLFEPLGYEEARGLQTLLMIAKKDR